MLYEVITDRIYQTSPWVVFRMDKATGETMGRGPVMDARADIATANKTKDRITSYNVCYTKLLRCWSAETIAYLRCGSANTEKSVRSMMGQWLKRHEPSEVIETIRSAEASCAAQPLPWVNKALGNRIAERKAGVAPFAPRKPAEPSGLVGALVRLNREAGLV